MRVATCVYVVAVMSLTAIATADPHELRVPLLVAALVLCLPTVVPAVVPLYLLLAGAWNLAGSDPGDPTWPVTATWTIGLGAVAVGNALVLARIRRSRAVHVRRR